LITGQVSADTERALKARNDFRGLLLQALGGIFFVATSIFTWRQLQVNQRTLEVKTDEVAQSSQSTTKQLALAEQSAVVDRLARAIDHLGSTGLTTRLGGIYSLKHIAGASSEYHGIVVDLLSAFIIDSSRISPKASPSNRSLRQDKPDVQEALTILAIGLAQSIDAGISLTDCDLRGADLVAAKLARVDLDGTWLDNADLKGSSLADANLRNARLRAADLTAANLSGANLMSADLTGAVLVRTRLQRAFISLADFRCARLESVFLQGCNGGEEAKWPEGFKWREATDTAIDSFMSDPTGTSYKEPETVDLGSWHSSHEDDVIDITARGRGSEAFITVQGELDLLAGLLLYRCLTDLLAQGITRLVLILSGVTFLGSGALSELYRIKEEIEHTNFSMVFRNPSRNFLRPLAALDLMEDFEIEID
jgi:anti-anti-sigma factor